MSINIEVALTKQECPNCHMLFACSERFENDRRKGHFSDLHQHMETKHSDKKKKPSA